MTGGDQCLLSNVVGTYSATEVIEVNCEECDSVVAHMEKRLTSQPQILVLHFRRFVPNLQKRCYETQHHNVNVPIYVVLKQVAP